MNTETTTLDVGLHLNVPASVYHADPCTTPSLSSGAARTILAKSPAHVAMENVRLGGKSRTATESMETGSLIHAILASDDSEIRIGLFDSYMSKAAKEWRDNTRHSGYIPVLSHDYENAMHVADIVRKRCVEGITNTPFCGYAENEVTAIWRDGDVLCRARYDVLVRDGNGNADIWDWKSTKDVSDRGIEKTIANYRYDIQAAFYMRGLEALGFKSQQISFIFVFFETVAPYTVRRVVLSQEYLQQAKKEVSQAISLWQQCLANSSFPTMPPDTMTVEIPHYLSENDGDITIE